MRRVVITGMGAISPIGNTLSETWASAKEGKGGIGLIDRFDITDFSAKIAGQVKDFDAGKYIEKKEQKKMDLFIQYGMTAGIEAFEDSGYVVTDENSERFGVCVGSGIGGLPAIEHWKNVINEKGPGRISPFFIPMVLINLISGHLSIRVKAKGPNTSTVTACAAGTHAVGDSFRMIKHGYADAMLAGGAEAAVTPLGVGGFAAMKALSTRNDSPETASRPFDKDRDGFVMGEGSGVVMLEEMESAKKRGAKIYAEVIGYGMTGDANHMTTPAPGGEGAQRCMKLALSDAGLNVTDVDYINAHGTSTYYNDLYETMAIKAVFGDHAGKLAISSTKGMTGHLLGAAGGIETILSAMALKEGVLPPTINYSTKDDECDLDYIPNESREMKAKVVISNSFGFGGTNGVLALKAFEG